MSPPLTSVLVLVLGALLILCLTARLTRDTSLLATIGVGTVVVALLPVLRGDMPTLMAVGAILVAGLVGMFLLPSSELEESTQRPEVAALILLGSAGAITLATGGDLLTALVGLETLSLSAAVLIALGRGDHPLEAAFKYFVLAAISVSLTIYGLGLIYLATGSFAWPTIAGVEPAYGWIWTLGVLLLVVGIAYKLAIVPMHWGPLDAYTAGAPGLAGYVMAASKVGAVVAISRVVVGAVVPIPTLFVLGIVSIVWGTFGALAQTETRRMLAYSTIANAGFIALALACGPDGQAAALFYAVVYALTVLLIFAALSGRGTGPMPFRDVTGERLSPLRAFGLGLGLLSLSGIPPAPGFWAKLAVLDASWQVLGFGPTLIAALGGVAGVLYYLRPLPDLLTIARVEAPGPPLPSRSVAVLLTGAVVVVMGLAPGLIYAMARIGAG